MREVSLGQILLLIPLSFAVWRLSSLFAEESGPFNLFGKLRTFLVMSNNFILSELGEGISCMWCNSVWLGALASIFISVNVFEWIVFSFSLSAFSILIKYKFFGG